ncbi:MurR/RpiR family transcriptional regulator [Mesorhizobium sp.]|uniref:MurR/RpiR family transcriptional regulator n=1 Tax=Mesorhizobium sp. TaxID=1871066 RepID=UPI0025E60FF2|nr:MurR/RpiR family transcriptional regulator [Mesorhizobium sp.]
MEAVDMERAQLASLLAKEAASMPPLLQVAARFVQEHPTEVALMSMRKQARRIGVSHTTMVRLATWLGLDSYEDLRAIYARALSAPDHVWSSEASSAGPKVAGKGTAAVGRIAKTLAIQAASLGDASNAKQLLAVAGVLANSRHLFCLGLRSAHTVARHFAYLRSQLGKHVTVLDATTETGIGALDRAGSGDVMLAISFEPCTRATIELVQQVSRRGVTIVAITGSKVSPLARLAHESIILPSVFQSIVPALSATEILAALMVQRTGTRVETVRGKAEERLELFNVRLRHSPIDRTVA